MSLVKRLLRSAVLATVVAGLVAAPATAGDVRALGTNGRVLTVGAFTFVPTDGGTLVRVQSGDILSWELHDQDRLIGFGIVPGTEGAPVDKEPSLSRDPVSGDSFLAWSREPELGLPREIAWLRFRANGPDASTLQTLATGLGNQVQPAVLHDERGNAFVAYVDESNGRQVKLLGISQLGVSLGVKDVSMALSGANSAPRLGINAVGNIFVAYVGGDLSSGEPTLYVASRSTLIDGVNHIPNPLVELGVQATLPAPTFVLEPQQAAFTADLKLTVLGGTAIAYWTEMTSDNRLLFRYVAEGAEGWMGSSVQTVDLSTGMLGSVPDALELLEARLRRVIAISPAVEAPGLPMPGRGVSRPGLVDRR